MVCKYCGNIVDDNAAICPFCGSALSSYDTSTFPQDDYEQPIYVQSNPFDQFDSEKTYAPADDGGDDDDGDDYDYDDQPATKAPKAKKGFSFSMPNLPLNTILLAACLIFTVVAMFGVFSLKSKIADSTSAITSGINQLQSSYSALDSRLSSLDTTVANVQSEAYNQLASRSITITKDITSLVGPVSLGKYNRMFIVDVKGNIDLMGSFDWQKYDEATGTWKSVEFTGNNSANEDMGLRLENLNPEDENGKKQNDVYRSVLWANGITKNAAGSYRCVITDKSGITKTSAEATVQVADA